MIEIRRFQEWLVELKGNINKAAEGARIEGACLAVHEGHMIKKLRDRRGIMLCGKYPDGQVKGVADAFCTENQVLLFLLEKVPSGQHSDEDELAHYARMQELVRLLREKLWEGSLLCDDSIRLTSDLTIEWEYDIFGGWNGLSIGFKLEDFD